MVYCVKCEKMVFEEHRITIQKSNSPDPGSRWDIQECHFPLGFTYCPPPQVPSEEPEDHDWYSLTESFLSDQFSYDAERDEIVMESLC